MWFTYTLYLGHRIICVYTCNIWYTMCSTWHLIFTMCRTIQTMLCTWTLYMYMCNRMCIVSCSLCTKHYILHVVCYALRCILHHGMICSIPIHEWMYDRWYCVALWFVLYCVILHYIILCYTGTWCMISYYSLILLYLCHGMLHCVVVWCNMLCYTVSPPIPFHSGSLYFATWHFICTSNKTSKPWCMSRSPCL